MHNMHKQSFCKLQDFDAIDLHSVYNLQSALCNLQSALCNLQSTMCNLQHALYNLQSSYNLQPALYNLQSALCKFAYIKESYCMFSNVSMFLNNCIVCNYKSINI